MVEQLLNLIERGEHLNILRSQGRKAILREEIAKRVARLKNQSSILEGRLELVSADMNPINSFRERMYTVTFKSEGNKEHIFNIPLVDWEDSYRSKLLNGAADVKIVYRGQEGKHYWPLIERIDFL